MAAVLMYNIDFNPRSPCGERPAEEKEDNEMRYISIHAPRVGSDGRCKYGRRGRPRFQSTLPVWGATQSTKALACYINKFQSTLPVWGATFKLFLFCNGFFVFQSTLPVWGAT